MAAAAAAGAAMGAALAFLGGLLSPPARAAIVVVLCAALAIGAALRRNPWPQLDRETEQSLLHHGPIVWALANGGQLGAGFTSRIGFWSWYLIPLGAFLLANPVVGAVAWAAYGAVRLTMAVLIAYGSTSPEELLARSVATLQRRAGATAATRLLTVSLALVLGLTAAL